MVAVFRDMIRRPLSTFGCGIGDRVHQVVQDAFGVFFNQMSRFDQRGEVRGPDGFQPVPEKLECPSPRTIASAPEGVKAVLFFFIITGSTFLLWPGRSMLFR